MRVPSGKAKMVGVPAVRCKYATFLLKYSYIRVMTTTFATALALCCMIYRPLRKLAIAQCIMLPATTYTVHVSRTTAMLHPLPWSSSPFAHRANHEWTCRHTLFFLSLSFGCLVPICPAPLCVCVPSGIRSEPILNRRMHAAPAGAHGGGGLLPTQLRAIS